MGKKKDRLVCRGCGDLLTTLAYRCNTVIDYWYAIGQTEPEPIDTVVLTECDEECVWVCPRCEKVPTSKQIAYVEAEFAQTGRKWPHQLCRPIVTGRAPCGR